MGKDTSHTSTEDVGPFDAKKKCDIIILQSCLPKGCAINSSFVFAFSLRRKFESWT